jgi:predicted nucleic acid-binding protein
VIVLLDTDVLVDLALDRAPHADAAAALLDRLQHRPKEGFVAWHIISNFYYLVVPRQGRSSTIDFIIDLMAFIDIAPASKESLRFAAQLPMKDFQDAMQVAAAMACGAERIATRNVRDYTNSPIKALSPNSLLDLLLK